MTDYRPLVDPELLKFFDEIKDIAEEINKLLDNESENRDKINALRHKFDDWEGRFKESGVFIVTSKELLEMALNALKAEWGVIK
jgi:septation ring formation regulator EzrA